MPTEREKMLAGDLYRPDDPELRAAHRRAQRLTRLYNATTEEETERRRELLERIFARIGETIVVEPPFHCDYGRNTEIGENFYANFNCVILDTARVSIGDDVMLAPSVHIYAATHPLDAKTRYSGLELSAPVTIGNRVWIGGGAIVNPGVTIGDGAVIGSGSVVTGDIPPNVVAAGNPCRVIRAIDQ